MGQATTFKGGRVPRPWTYFEEFPIIDIADVKPSLLRVGLRLRTPKRDPDYRFNVFRSNQLVYYPLDPWPADGLTLFYRGDLEVVFSSKGKKRRPRWFCGVCGNQVDRMFQRRHLCWICGPCLQRDVGPLRHVSRDRPSMERMDVVMQAAKWRAGDFSARYVDIPPMFSAPHLTDEAAMAATDQWEQAWERRCDLLVSAVQRL